MSEEDRGSKPPGDGDSPSELGGGALQERPTIDELIDEYADDVFALCMQTLRNREDARDASQKVFCDAQRDLGQLRGRAGARAWLFSIAYHRCVDIARVRKRDRDRNDPSESALDAIEDSSLTPAQRVARQQLYKALFECIGKLPVKAAVAILLRFWYGMTFEEMSAGLGESANTLQVRVSRGLKTLGECLAGKGWDGD